MPRNPGRETTFRFKQFSLANNASAMKIGTDGVLLGAWASASGNIREILDIGTGTGLIALMLAQRFDGSNIKAIEIDTSAALEAMSNVAASPWTERIEVINDNFNTWACDSRFDLIVSNPPFFSTGQRAADPHRAMARHTDSMTISDILVKASQLLSPDGHLCLITPADMSDDIMFEATLNHLNICKKCDIITTEGKKPSRSMWDLTASECQPTLSTLTIRNNDGYSDQYRQLTEDFYIHF